MFARIAVPRSPAFRTIARRGYTAGRSEGSVAESKGFSKKEKAVEDQYARKHEAEQLKKIRAQIEQKQKEILELEKAAAETKPKA
ncbi:hypothetical protein PENSPDRAFT_683765 [Peniophora sp. CONT]|nr:hypothetical protein PENSPDRAFT_683765 [Peniophora sp. CONT]